MTSTLGDSVSQPFFVGANMMTIGMVVPFRLFFFGGDDYITP